VSWLQCWISFFAAPRSPYRSVDQFSRTRWSSPMSEVKLKRGTSSSEGISFFLIFIFPFFFPLLFSSSSFRFDSGHHTYKVKTGGVGYVLINWGSIGVPDRRELLAWIKHPRNPNVISYNLNITDYLVCLWWLHTGYVCSAERGGDSSIATAEWAVRNFSLQKGLPDRKLGLDSYPLRVHIRHGEQHCAGHQQPALSHHASSVQEACFSCCIVNVLASFSCAGVRYSTKSKHCATYFSPHAIREGQSPIWHSGGSNSGVGLAWNPLCIK
jgi:hypothetical protein